MVEETLVAGGKGKVIVCTNSAWTLYHFRLSLMLALKERGFDVIAAGPRDRYAADFEPHGIPFVGLPMSVSGRNPLRELRLLVRFWRLYRQTQPVLVHHFSAKAVLFGSLAARLAGVPAIVNTVTGLGYTFAHQRGPYLWAVQTLARMALRPPVRTIFQNPDDLEYFVGNGLLRRHQAALIPGSGIHTERFAPACDGAPARNGRPLHFLMFSRMIWEKGVREYHDAAQAVTSHYAGGKRAEFILLGGAAPGNPTGVDAEWLANPSTIPSEYLEQLAQRGVVTWFPHDNNVLPYIQRADVVVLPTYYPEGLPRSLLEAMACGKPVITTDIPGCRDLVDHGVSGLLVRPRDVNSLAKAMIELIEQPQLVRRMGLAARQRIVDRFSDARIIEQTFAQYAEAGVKG